MRIKGIQPGTNLTQALNPVRMQTPPLGNQKAPVFTSSPAADSGFAEAAQSRGRAREGDTEILSAAPLHTGLSA